VREFSLRVFPETTLGNLGAAVVSFPVIVLLSVACTGSASRSWPCCAGSRGQIRRVDRR
jgi:hypothetical protein